MQRAEAAKKYWKTHDFDPVNCRFYDEKKEEKFCNERAEMAKTHGQDEVKKLPITVQNEGLMYNPVNMKIEDSQRLYEKDLREKNKKARFEVRYDFEQNVRKEGMAEMERDQQRKINKISGLRFKEETSRGFDILTNDKLQGAGVANKMEQVSNAGPAKAWKRVLLNSNENDLKDPQIKVMQEEEYYQKLKERGITNDFKKTELEKLHALGKDEQFKETCYLTRSKRLTGSIPCRQEEAAPASKASMGSAKGDLVR